MTHRLKVGDKPQAVLHPRARALAVGRAHHVAALERLTNSVGAQLLAAELGHLVAVVERRGDALVVERRVEGRDVAAAGGGGERGDGGGRDGRPEVERRAGEVVGRGAGLGAGEGELEAGAGGAEDAAGDLANVLGFEVV